MTPSAIADSYLAAQVRAAIKERLVDRHWYRRIRAGDRGRYTTYWADLGRENDIRLRELVRVARTARDLARPIIVHEAAIDRAKADALAAGDFYAGMAR